MEVSDQLQALVTLNLGGRVPYALDTGVILVRQHITVEMMEGLPAPSDKPILIHRSQSLSPSHYTTVEHKCEVKPCSLVH